MFQYYHYRSSWRILEIFFPTHIICLLDVLFVCQTAEYTQYTQRNWDFVKIKKKKKNKVMKINNTYRYFTIEKIISNIFTLSVYRIISHIVGNRRSECCVTRLLQSLCCTIHGGESKEIIRFLVSDFRSLLKIALRCNFTASEIYAPSTVIVKYGCLSDNCAHCK